MHDGLNDKESVARVHDGAEVLENESCVFVRPVLEDVLHYVAITPATEGGHPHFNTSFGNVD